MSFIQIMLVFLTMFASTCKKKADNADYRDSGIVQEVKPATDPIPQQGQESNKNNTDIPSAINILNNLPTPSPSPSNDSGNIEGCCSVTDKMEYRNYIWTVKPQCEASFSIAKPRFVDTYSQDECENFHKSTMVCCISKQKTQMLTRSKCTLPDAEILSKKNCGSVPELTF